MTAAATARPPARRWGTGVVAGLAAWLAAGCAANADDDAAQPDRLAPVERSVDATPVVVDTDLAGDDLVALAFLLRHPDVEVRAVTVAATGLVGCDPGVDLVADLFSALDAEPVPVACGRAEPGPGGRPWPQAWVAAAGGGSGLTRDDGSWQPQDVSATELIGRLAEDRGAGEAPVVVALGPLTNLADLARSAPRAYARLGGIQVMAGSVDGPLLDGVAEWNAAADPEAFAEVLAGPAPVTVVPEDAVPDGTPDALDAPVVAPIAAAVALPAWWDLATTAALVAPDAARVETGRWVLDPAEPGRLRRAGDGEVRVVRSLDADLLDAAYRLAFG